VVHNERWLVVKDAMPSPSQLNQNNNCKFSGFGSDFKLLLSLAAGKNFLA
jgi:hypothetical protein